LSRGGGNWHWNLSDDMLYCVWTSGGRYVWDRLYIEAKAEPKPQPPKRVVTVQIGDNTYTSEGKIYIAGIEAEYTEEELDKEINMLRRARDQYNREKIKGEW
jgi:hypothetical protein